MVRTPKLHPIPGNFPRPVKIGTIDIVSARRTLPPFSVEMEVIEEDTWLVLSAKTSLEDAERHPIRVMTDLIEQEMQQPGNILHHGRRCLAIVYDLEQDPICQSDWVHQAMRKILDLAEREGIRSLALPLLGCMHGPLTWQKSLDIIIQELLIHNPTRLQRVWLVVSGEQQGKVKGRLELNY